VTKGGFILGPYSTRREKPISIDESIDNTGCVLEFSTSAEPYTLQIFRLTGSFPTSDFARYVVKERQIPFGIECFPFQVRDLPGGPYISLSAFLAELYTFFPDARSVKSCLADLAESLCLPSNLDDNVGAREPIMLPTLAIGGGYHVSSVFPYGRRIFVDFAWSTPQADQAHRGMTVQAGGADFRPRPDRSLGPGKWITHRTHCIEAFLFGDLRRLAGGPPVNLFRKENQFALLDEFEWTPLTLMTAKQARNARIEFIRNHPALVPNHKELAKALKQAQLYSDDTSVSQICRFLPSMLTAISAGAGGLPETR
jgi:hypothetical protein